jgi:hypothetical protein
MGGRLDAPRFVYVESPDGHVFELMDADTAGTVSQIHKTIALLAEQDLPPAA